MPRTIRYGLYRAGKVKMNNDPNFRLIVEQMHTARPMINHRLKKDKPTKYSTKNTRQQYQKQLQNAEQNNEAANLHSRIENLEFGMEKRSYSELTEKNRSSGCYRENRNHKKWQRNHRDVYSSREVESLLVD